MKNRYLYVKYVEYTDFWKSSYKEERERFEILNYIFFDDLNKKVFNNSISGYNLWVCGHNGYAVILVDIFRYKPKNHSFLDVRENLILPIIREQKIDQILV